LRIGISLKSYEPQRLGPGTYTVEIVEALLRLDLENEYVLLAPRLADPTALQRIAPHRTDVRRILADVPPGIRFDQLELPRHAREHGVDLLFSPFQSLPVAGDFAKVMTVHGAERYVVPEILDWSNRLKWRFMELLCLPRADAVIAVSRTMARDFCAATGFAESRVFTTYLAASPRFRVDRDRSRLAAVRARHGIDGPFLLLVGGLFPNKNVAALLQAFATIRHLIPHRLVIAGGLRWKYAADLDALDRLALGDRVQRLGFIAADDLVALYNAATCFVLPSLYESFGLAMVEAMACGCPVVASRTGAMPEIAGDAALYCDPRDPGTIAEAILRLANDRELRRALAASGIARAADFSWERCARETLAAFEAVARRRARAQEAVAAALPATPPVSSRGP
jgi:glycosyltransferase involved in cell wall biosynthesis